ncbi:hypothetical protein GTR02_21720, partial [Kineococcus sp. R8]
GRRGLDPATRRARRVLATRTHDVVDGTAVVVARELRTSDVAVGAAVLLPAVAVGAPWALLLAVLALCAHAALRVRHARAGRREAVAAHAVRAAAGCRCFETPVLAGDPALRALAGHLVPATGAAVVAPLAALGPGAALACCPSTGFLWLRPAGRDLLLRGRPAGTEPEDAAPPGEGPTGFYP